MKIIVEGKAGEGKSAIINEIMFMMTKLGFEVGIQSYEQHPMRDHETQKTVIEHIKAAHPRIMIEERQTPHIDAREKPTVLLASPPTTQFF